MNDKMIDSPTEDGCSLWDVVGTAKAATLLRRMADEGRVPHALLLAGPPRVGKARLALELACALNHQEQDCRQCARIRGGKHADVEVVAPGGLTLEASSDNPRSRVISIAQVRRLEMVAASHPYEGRQRVFIVDPADAMNDDAADAFLKTLEEPASFVTFVLVTARPALLKETVLSRCTRIDVAPMPVAELAAWLSADHELDAEQAATLARLARGRAGWALDAIEEGDPFALRHGQIEEIKRLAAQGRAERFKYAEGLVPRGQLEPVDALTAVEQWSAWWRDVLLLSVGEDERVAHRDHLDDLHRAVASYRPADVVRFLIALERSERFLREGVNPRITLDALFTQIPEPREGRTRVEAAV